MDPLEALKEFDFEIFESPGPDGKGNYVFKVLFPDEDPRILKLYRSRWSPWQEFTENLLAKTVLRRTAGKTSDRFESEKYNLTRWREEGFQVPKIIEAPFPEGIQQPALWMEFCEGPHLLSYFQNKEISWDDKFSRLHHLGQDLGARYKRAAELDEVRLIHKHGTLEHILVEPERLVTIDLEGSYLRGFKLLEAMTRELSGFLRSIAKNSEDKVDTAFNSLIDGFQGKDLLIEISDWAIHGNSITRRLSRKSDRKKRAQLGKTQMMERLNQLLKG